MPRIIPAILVQDEKGFRRQISLAAAFAPPAVQIDVLDGTLFPQKAFGDPSAVAAMHLTLPFEAHLMVNAPEKAAAQWIKAGAERIIVHEEAKGNIGLALEKIRLAGRKAGIAINPETDLSLARDWAPFVDYFLVMGVHPGRQGQAFNPETAARVRALKKFYPQIKVGVDGGIDPAAAAKLATAGADDLTVGSYLWNAANPLSAYKELVTAVK